MAKKSHRIASRQAAISKERKRKKRAQSAGKQNMPVGSASPKPSGDYDVAPPASPQEVQQSVQVRQPDTHYHYVATDLRTIGLIAGPLVIVLIILAIVL